MFEFSLKGGNLQLMSNKSTKLSTEPSRVQVIAIPTADSSNNAEGKQADKKQMGRKCEDSRSRVENK